MLVLDRHPRIRIDLDPGVYVFDSESGTGRSYLCSLFKQYRAYGDPVWGFSYDDILKGHSLSELVAADFAVLMLESYDLYAGACIIDIARSHPGSVILIDSMSGTVDADYDVAYVRYDSDGLEIHA